MYFQSLYFQSLYCVDPDDDMGEDEIEPHAYKDIASGRVTPNYNDVPDVRNNIGYKETPPLCDTRDHKDGPKG
ncbi:MAG: hypothetical protein GY765_41475 [bacterium]|nr:hypothetical protein [bacterium]